MRTSITISPKFDFLKEYIEQVPRTFESVTEVLYRDRNLIKADNVSNLKLVIKSFGRIYLTNRIRYSYFYPSKAERAYKNGLRLLENGFLTPEPVAFIEIFRGGLLKESYFISLHTDFTPLASVSLDDEKGLVKDLAGFAHRLHRHGIFHMDFSRGNILCKKENDHFQFSLVDNNRMQFRKFDFAKGLKTFKRLGLDERQLTEAASEYARLENRDQAKAVQYIFDVVRRHQQMDHMRKTAKRWVIKPR